MSVQLENCLNNEYLKKIEALAALSLYGQNVKIAIHHIVKDACSFAANQAGDPTMHLLAFKGRLTELAKRTHPSMPGYIKTLEYAASLVVVQPARSLRT